MIEALVIAVAIVVHGLLVRPSPARLELPAVLEPVRRALARHRPSDPEPAAKLPTGL